MIQVQRRKLTLSLSNYRNKIIYFFLLYWLCLFKRNKQTENDPADRQTGISNSHFHIYLYLTKSRFLI